MQAPGIPPRDTPSILKAKRNHRCSGSVWGVHPTQSPGSGSGWTAGDYSLRGGYVSIVANTPTLLCETDSPFSPPPIKLTNHPPFPGSERQKRSSCTQTDRELSSEGQRGVFQETLEQLPVNTLEEMSVTTSLSKLPSLIVRKELTSIGSWGGHELFQLNPTWNHLQPGQGSVVTATEHQL